MERRIRAAKVFFGWLAVFFAQAMLYTAHRGFDLVEAAITAPIFAAAVTAYWMRKFPS